MRILSKDTWSEMSESAHLICFSEHRPKSMDKIDYCLFIEDEGVPCSYATVREIDEETFYLQYGGAFPSIKGTVNSFKCYLMVINYLLENYKRGTTYVENTNTAMIKFALKAGGIITGIRNFEGSVLLEITFKD